MQINPILQDATEGGDVLRRTGLLDIILPMQAVLCI